MNESFLTQQQRNKITLQLISFSITNELLITQCIKTLPRKILVF